MQLTVALALHLLLIVAVIQAWMSGWPGKIPLTIGAVIAIVASGLLIRRWRSAPLIVGAVSVAAIFLWPSLRFGADAGGLRIGGLPFGVAAAALVVVALIGTGWLLWKARFVSASAAMAPRHSPGPLPLCSWSHCLRICERCAAIGATLSRGSAPLVDVRLLPRRRSVASAWSHRFTCRAWADRRT